MGMTLNVTLPLGIKSPDGTWTKEVELEEMTGVEEDILADSRRVQVGGKGKRKGEMVKSNSRRFTEILSRCTVRMGGCTRPGGQTKRSAPAFFENAWEQAFSTDRVAALIRLRQISLGDVYDIKTTCPACGVELFRALNLDDLEVKSLPIEDIRKNEGVFQKTLKTGKLISWKILRGVDEPKMVQLLRERGADIGTALIALHLTDFGGVVPTDEMLQELSARDRAELRIAFDEEAGGIDTSAEIGCSACEHEFSLQVSPATPDFFFPSAAR
jgi:rRNA maturation protein Nop10